MSKRPREDGDDVPWAKRTRSQLLQEMHRLRATLRQRRAETHDKRERTLDSQVHSITAQLRDALEVLFVTAPTLHQEVTIPVWHGRYGLVFHATDDVDLVRRAVDTVWVPLVKDVAYEWTEEDEYSERHLKCMRITLDVEWLLRGEGEELFDSKPASIGLKD